MIGTEPMAPLATVAAELTKATRARKCGPCGCFREAVEGLAASPAAGDLGPVLADARAVLKPVEYACLGCPTCWPAVATNAFAEAFPDAAPLAGCLAEPPVPRPGRPPLPGDYHVLRARAPVAVCTLNDEDLARRLADADPPGLAIVGTLRTENLGIERVIQNVVANPRLRFLVLCGEDNRQAVGHLPGASLKCLVAEGVDDRGRILGAPGKRPVLRNVDGETIAAFRRQVALVDHLGVDDVDALLEVIAACQSRDPGPVDGVADPVARATVTAQAPSRLVPDPAGYLVVYPDGAARRLVVEHYANDGSLTAVLEGETPAALYTAAAERGLVSRLDHAAYLGRELARAERSLATGERYVQDRAAGEAVPPSEDASGAETSPEDGGRNAAAAGCGCGPDDPCGSAR